MATSCWARRDFGISKFPLKVSAQRGSGRAVWATTHRSSDLEDGDDAPTISQAAGQTPSPGRNPRPQGPQDGPVVVLHGALFKPRPQGIYCNAVAVTRRLNCITTMMILRSTKSSDHLRTGENWREILIPILKDVAAPNKTTEMSMVSFPVSATNDHAACGNRLSSSGFTSSKRRRSAAITSISSGSWARHRVLTSFTRLHSLNPRHIFLF